MNPNKTFRLAALIPPVTAIAAAMIVFGCDRSAHSPKMAPPDVMVVDVVQKDVAIYGDWIGTLDGLVNAQIHAQVSGYLMTQKYIEGDFVNKGALLFEIDPRPFQAALDKAIGQMEQAKANLDMTDIDVKRYTPLAKNNAISQQELDNAIQSNKGAKAALETAQAEVQQAKLNLEFTKITSPIEGIAGIAEAQVGDLVGPNTSELTAISTVDPIKVYFPISEQEYMKAMEHRMTTTNAPATNNLDLILANGDVYQHKGTIVIADRQVNVKTGTIRIAGLFPNPENLLRPGQYAHVRMPVKLHKNALMAPQRAVTEMQGSYLITVVDKNNRASIRQVQMGDRSDSDWIISKGLQPGERVVVEGIQKAREGVIVHPIPYKADAGTAPAPGAKPTAPKGIAQP